MTSKSNPRILVVEESPDVTRTALKVLQQVQPDAEVIVASRQPALGREIAKQPALVIITDIPGMSGLQLAAEVRATSPNTRIVLISQFATPALEERTREQGIDYLPRPLQDEQIENILREVFENG